VKDEMLYAKAIKPYIEYWEGILERLSKPFSKKNPILLEEFFDHLVIGKLIRCDSFFQFHLSLGIRKIQLIVT
jgi:hypothetical protein